MSRKPPAYRSPLVIGLSAHKFPEARQIMGKDWVYWGEKNDYYNFLLDLYYKSSKHNAIVNGKTKYIAGGGWGEQGKTPVNLDGETLNNLTWKTTLDEEIYGAEAFEVIWTQGGKTAEYRHLCTGYIRTNKDESEYYYTKNWITKHGNPVFDPTQNEDWEVYQPFDSEDRKGKQLLFYKCYSPGLDLYPLPEYKASLLYIELEYQVANYWYNRVKNGFMPSAILNFYMGQPTNDEMKKLEEKIGAKFAGTNNAGQFILNFASNKEFAADIQQITPPELGEEYEALNKTLQTEIFTGHGVTNGMLFGIKEPGQLGGRTELIEANELFQNRYVTPKQLKKEEFYDQYIFPYIKGLKPGLKLQKQEPIGYMFSESVMIKYLPERAIAEMVAAKMGIDLKKYPEFEKERAEKKKAEQEQKQGFKAEKEKKIVEHFRKKGKKRKGKVVYERPVSYEMSRNLKASEQELFIKLEKELPPVIVGSSTKPLNVKIDENLDEVISVVYSYEWLEGFSDADISTSRDFCVEMRTMSREGVTWTREDIEGLDNDAPPEVSDVWESRGGWYNDDGIPVPHCRHQWNQKVIRETRV